MKFGIFEIGDIQNGGVTDDFFDGEFSEEVFHDVITVHGQVAEKGIEGFGQESYKSEKNNGDDVVGGGTFYGSDDGVNCQFSNIKGDGGGDGAGGIGGKIKTGPLR